MNVPQCEELAPYLREKLLGDMEHTWWNAPYIHESVVEAIVESERQRYAPVNYYDHHLIHKLKQQGKLTE